MRIPRHLTPVGLLALLTVAGCGGGTQTDGRAPETPPAATHTATAAPPETPPATVPGAPSATPTVTAPDTPAATSTAVPGPVMPALHSRSYQEARAALDRREVPPARVTTAAQHKDVTLPRDHGGWYVCATSPRPGAPLTAATVVTVRLAEDFSDCTTSFHGYLHQENDPAYTPPAP
ncbi:hypothetical protein [Streptomyces pratensis]|uniref:hypothetical protein n=1 Tax=Streptomyces pratensis TaxID=1169025 RepID=UPI0030177CE7